MAYYNNAPMKPETYRKIEERDLTSTHLLSADEVRAVRLNAVRRQMRQAAKAGRTRLWLNLYRKYMAIRSETEEQ